MVQVFFGRALLENGDNDPSLSVKDDYITDFGGDFKGDIFQFVMELKGISQKEALELLKKDFSLNIDTSSFKEKKQTKSKKSKKANIIKKVKLVEGNPTDKICMMFDSVTFSKKPTGRTNWRNKTKNRKFKLYPLLTTRNKR